MQWSLPTKGRLSDLMRHALGILQTNQMTHKSDEKQIGWQTNKMTQKSDDKQMQPLPVMHSVRRSG
jgi:hypothetical protein